jgi:hypothetical protein
MEYAIWPSGSLSLMLLFVLFQITLRRHARQKIAGVQEYDQWVRELGGRIPSIQFFRFLKSLIKTYGSKLRLYIVICVEP